MGTNEEESNVHLAAALSLSWSFGVNKNVPVLNLSDDERKVVFYTTTHTGVLYNFEENTQVLYQGHCNSISCSAVSEDKRWLATADIGRECMLIIWDTQQNIPIKTIFDIDVIGTASICFSNDAKFIATLSCSLPQKVSRWDWTIDSDTPMASCVLDKMYGLQTYICFDSSNDYQLLSSNSMQVIFYKWNEDGSVLVDAPQLNDEDFNKTVGAYSQSVFEPCSNHIITASNCGNIIVWQLVNSKKFEHKALKIVRLQEKAITVLKLANGYIVTADVGGSVKFFDLKLKLLNWFKDFNVQGPINSLSFTHIKKAIDVDREELYATESTLEAQPFVVNDFTISTTKAHFAYFKTQGNVVEYVRKEHDKDVKAIACHPKSSMIALGGYDGLLQIMDFETKCLQHSLIFSGDHTRITSLVYSPTGDFLAIGFEDGHVKILDSITLEVEHSNNDQASFQFSNDAIMKLVFSKNSQYLACSDMDRCVVLYEFTKKNGEQRWSYLGKHRAHYKQISDILFTTSLDTNQPRLLSIGHDRMLVEYDIKSSNVDDLKILSSSRIEQNAVPLCLLDYPDIVKESFLVTANDEFKLKMFNSITKMCRHTFLGPTYGSPLQRLELLAEDKTAPNRYLAYHTMDKVGLIVLPLDGNPYKSMAMVAHPGQVHNMACSHDGKYIFTAGGADLSVLMWKINTDALEATAGLGGEGLTPFYSLLEGGRDGELFAQLEEFFYYSQIRNQGDDSMQQRQVSTHIPLAEIPFIMRALGYYPTEQEIDEMMNEIKFQEYVISGNYVKTIDLATLIKLYVNHRPVFGLQPNQLLNAFEKLAVNGGDDISIERSRFLQLLQDKGEHITENELAEYMTALLDNPFNTNDSDDDSDDDSSSETATTVKPLDEILPHQITAQDFSTNILGFTTQLDV